MKFRLLRDENAHWYMVPDHLTDEFLKWVSCSMEEFDAWKGEDFYKYRMNHHIGAYTFTDMTLEPR